MFKGRDGAAMWYSSVSKAIWPGPGRAEGMIEAELSESRGGAAMWSSSVSIAIYDMAQLCEYSLHLYDNTAMWCSVSTAIW